MRICALLLGLLVSLSLMVNGAASAMAGVRMHAAAVPAAMDGMPDCHAAALAHGDHGAERAPSRAPDGCGQHCACACACPQALGFAIAWLPVATLRYRGPEPLRVASAHPQPALPHPIRPPIG